MFEQIKEIERKDYARKNIHELRKLGRDIGVISPTSLSKNVLIDKILDILFGEAVPQNKETRGRPPKQSEEDVPYEYTYTSFNTKKFATLLASSSKTEYGYFDEEIDTGILDILEPSYGSLLVGGFATSLNDVLVPISLIKEKNLRDGDCLTVKTKFSKIKSRRVATEIIKINEKPISEFERKNFSEFQKEYPNQKFDFSEQNDVGKILNVVAPIGKGQSSLLVGEENYGRSEVLKDILLGIKVADENSKVFPIIFNMRYDEVQEYLSVLGPKNVADISNVNMFNKLVTISLAISRAERMVENGKDVVISIDSLNTLYDVLANAELAKVDNSISAIDYLKKLFSLASKFKEGASLTIIGGIDNSTENGKKIYDELKSIANNEIILNKEMAICKEYPPIDLFNSYTRKDELIMTSDEVQKYKNLKKSLASDTSLENYEKQLNELKK